MKNTFYFTEKAIFNLEIFTFLYFRFLYFFPLLTIAEAIGELDWSYIYKFMTPSIINLIVI